MKVKLPSPPKEELLTIFEKCANINEVAEFYDVNHRVIKCWFVNNGIFEIPSREDLLDKSQTMSRSEVAKYYKVSVPTINKWKKIRNISRYESAHGNLPEKLTETQLNIVNGKLLGDSWLTRINENSNSAFFVKQKADDLEYVKSVHESMLPFSRKISLVKAKEHYCKEQFVKTGNSYEFGTIASPIFTKLRHLWYPNGTKIVPKDLKLNWEIVSYWFCDDGCNYKHKYDKIATFHTQGFDIGSVKFLVDQLENLGIESFIKFRNNQPIIQVRRYCRDKLINGIRPYVTWNCMERKVK